MCELACSKNIYFNIRLIPPLVESFLLLRELYPRNAKESKRNDKHVVVENVIHHNIIKIQYVLTKER